MSTYHKKLKFRSFFLLFLIACIFVVIFLRLIYLQIYNQKHYVQYSNKQFIRKTKVYPNRGQIYDRNNQPLALNVRNYNIFIMPRNLKDLGTVTYEIGKVIPEVRYRKLYKKIKARNRFTWIKRNYKLTPKSLERLKSLEGVHVEPAWGRFYPNNSLASQILGFVNIDNKGLSGLEFLFNEELAGVEKTISYVRDAKGRALKFEAATKTNEPKDLKLSIDKEIQRIAEKYLKEGVLHHKARSGGIGVMDARTGEIWAMANYPSFNSNEPGKSDIAVRKLSFISDPFEPGSVIKTHTIATALESQDVKLNTMFNCENGQMKVGREVIRESANHKYKFLSVEDILGVSSNIGTSKIAFKLGEQKMLEGLRSFGYGVKTKIELPSESKGILNVKNKLKKIKLSNISFGQGFAATGIQVLRSYAPFANGGFWVEPTLFYQENYVEPTHRLLNKKTVISMRKALRKVIEEGTGANAKVLNFQIAGKTGTAQMHDKKKAGYLKGEYLASFAGFPIGADRPFVIFVYVKSPKENGYYGNEVAAPIFKKVAESILIRNNEIKSSLVSVSQRSLKKFKQNGDKLRLKQAGVKRISKNKVPNFIGLDSRSVKEMATKFKVKVDMVGRGITVKQTPKAFSKLSDGQSVKLYLKIPDYE